MSSEYIKHNGQKVKKSSVMSRGKRYRYNKQGAIEEITGSTTLTADDFVISGSKSTLRRISDIEQNVAMIYTRLNTTDGETASTSETSDDISVGKSNTTTRFKGDVRFEKNIDAKSSASVGSTFADKVISSASQYVATQSWVNTQVSAEASARATAIASASASANAYADAAVSALVNGASASFDTLKEIQNAMATDAELSAAISGLSIGNGTVTISAGNGLTGGGAFSMNQSSSETVGLNVGGGNGISVSADGVAMSGSYTGTFTATGDICAYSDASLKTNIETIEGALGKVESIRGVTFDRIEDGSTSVGVVAQELEAVLPEAVHTDANGTKMVAYGNVTGLLIEAVKELSAQVAELKK